MRLAEVAAVVALLPIWEVDGLADLHPYLREEFGDGDEALVVCPEGFVGDDRVEVSRAVPVVGVRVREFRDGGDARERAKRATESASATTTTTKKDRRRLHFGYGGREAIVSAPRHDSQFANANPAAKALEARRPRRATEADSDDDGGDGERDGARDQLRRINERCTLGNRVQDAAGVHGGGG